MKSSSPLISVGLPVYNGENFVIEAIKCVLSQTLSDWELIISDNTSTDRTVSICREFAERDGRIRVYRNDRNLGVLPNFNRVVELSHGRYFKWISHDDVFGAEFIACCIQALEEDPKAVLAFPRVVYIDKDGRPLRRQEASDLSIIGQTADSRVSQLMTLETQNTDIFWSQFGVIRRKTLQDSRLMGLYNGSDQVLLLKLALRGNLRQVQKELFFRREHPAASTMRAGWTAKERAAFGYSDDARTMVFPYCRLLKEHLSAIQNSSIPFREKTRCAFAVLRRFRSQWKYFAYEIIQSPLETARAKKQGD